MKLIAKTLAAVLMCAVSATALQAAETPNASSDFEIVKDRVGIMPMDSKLLLVFINAGEGKNPDLNRFYDQHIREFMNLPQMVRGQHFMSVHRVDKQDPDYQHVIAFEYKGHQDENLAKIQAGLKDGSIGTAPEGFVTKIEGNDYEPIGPGFIKQYADVDSTRAGLAGKDRKFLIVLANAGEGKDKEFNEYYDSHVQDYLRYLPMMQRAQRFRVVSRSSKGDPEHKYAIVYEYTGSQHDMARAVRKSISSGEMKLNAPGVVAKIQGNDYEPLDQGYRRVVPATSAAPAKKK